MTNQVNIAEKLMVVRLNCSFSFGRITDRPLTSQVNHANKTHALQVKKDLFPADAGTTLRALHAVLSTFYAYHKRVTMSSVNEGERLMPVAFYLDYMNEFGTYKVLVEEAYDSFCSSYDQSISRSQNHSRNVFQPGEITHGWTIGLSFENSRLSERVFSFRPQS